MQILLISATPFEVEPLFSYVSKQWKQENSCVFSKKNCRIEILYTGVGSVATTYNLHKKLLQNAYDLVIQAGVAGAFSNSIALGSVWAIASDCFNPPTKSSIAAGAKGFNLPVFSSIISFLAVS